MFELVHYCDTHTHAHISHATHAHTPYTNLYGHTRGDRQGADWADDLGILAYEGEAVCAETGKTLRIVSSADALALFDRRRTLDPSGHSQGVTGISQLRCVAAGKRQG